MEIRIISSNEKIFTETEVQRKINKLEEIHLRTLEKERREKNHLINKLNNARMLISRLTERLMVSDIEQMLIDWEVDYEEDPKVDRKQFAKKIVSYLSNVQQI